MNENNSTTVIKENSNPNHIYDFLKNSLNNALSKDNSIVDLRSKLLNYAILIFAGLFSLGVTFYQNKRDLIAKNTLGIISIIDAVQLLTMIIFCLWDRKLHKLNHLWDYVRKYYTVKIGEFLNNPKGRIEILMRFHSGQKPAEIFSFQPVLYYCLILCSLIYFIVTLVVYLW